METKDYCIIYTYCNDFIAMVRCLVANNRAFLVRPSCDTAYKIVLYGTTIEEIKKMIKRAKYWGAEDTPTVIED